MEPHMRSPWGVPRFITFKESLLVTAITGISTVSLGGNVQLKRRSKQRQAEQ